MLTNDATAAALRMLHPLRFERLAISDMNPMLWPLKVVAETVRQHRRPAAADNSLRAAEKAVAQQIEAALDRYRDVRDRGQELAFKAIYNAPLVEALAGLRGAYADARKPRARDEHGERMLQARIEAIRTREEQGGFTEAVLRIMLAVARAERMVDARGLRLAQRIKQEHPVLSLVSREQMRAAAKAEAFMLRFDEERALAALPVLLPSEAERREAVEIVRRIGYADGVITPESEVVLAKIERILGLEAKSDAEPPAKAAKRPRRNGAAERRAS
jgi:tellurite resistance protein